MTSLVGKKLQDGKYILTQELGEGGFGCTYQAVNQILNQIVVIKTFKSSTSKEIEMADLGKQFLNEAQRLVQCYHANIVRFYEFFSEDGIPYIVMDYIEGKTLHNIVLPNNPLPEATAIKYIRQIGEALKVVHSQGLLHRDIKPQNLILRQDNQQVVLIDFGIAREFNQGMIQTHTNVVSDGYAPIEQYLPKAKRTPASDIYGLAATLYTLVTARIPIAATLRNRIALDNPREIQPELSDQISQAIMKGITLEPEERPSSVEEWLTLLPKNDLSPESANTVCLTAVQNNSINMPAVSQLKKSSYLNRVLQGVIIFASIVWGLDYVWLRVQTSNSVEKPNSTKSLVIKDQESEPITPEKTEESNSVTPTSTSSPKIVTPTPIKQSTPPKTAPSTFVSSPKIVTPTPIKQSTPPKIPRTVVSPPRKVTPKRTTRPSSNRVPSVFVSPNRKVTPKTNNSSNRVPSVFASPSNRKRIERK